MTISTIVCEILNKKLPDYLLAEPCFDGAKVVVKGPERHLSSDLWLGVDGLWRWKSDFIGDEFSGSGTVFDGVDAVMIAARKTCEDYQIPGHFRDGT